MADPLKYENLFPGFAEALETEKQRNLKANNNNNFAHIIQRVPKDEVELHKERHGNFCVNFF